MRWNELRQTISYLHDRWPIPNVIIFHLSGNDIGRSKTLDLILQIKLDLLCLHAVLPNTVVVFSEVI